jgi:hypothetical protein
LRARRRDPGTGWWTYRNAPPSRRDRSPYWFRAV